MKILIGGITHETNTFSNVKTDEDAFRQWDWHIGTEVFQNRGVRNYIGGMLDQADSLGIEVIPTFSTFAYPSGAITANAHTTLIDTLINQIRSSENYDVVLLSLHGAGVTETTEDLEGYVLKEVRKVVGESIPIIVTLDLHANMTKKMVETADVILGNHLYPHTDSYEVGAEAVNIAKKIVEQQLKPTMYLKQIPMIIPTSTTNLSPAKDINEICYDLEKQEDVVDCTFYHGFPYTNISRLGVSVLVTTNNNPKLAENIAHKVSQTIWNKKKDFIQEQPSPKEGIELALAHKGKPVILNETSDNPGGGTPGDGTFLLRAMVESDLKNVCYAFIYDPDVVQTAIQKGVGATIDIELGGKTDNLHGQPIKMDAYVKVISDGAFIQSSPMGKGSHVNLGPSVRLQYNGVDIIVCSVKSQVLDEEIFKLHGIDIQKYKIIGLKSSQHFRAGFENISSKIITVDSPGLSTLDFRSFDYSRLETKLFPLHDVSYE